MAPPKKSSGSGGGWSISAVFLTFSLLFTLSLLLFFLLSSPRRHHQTLHFSPPPTIQSPTQLLKVYLADLPRSLNYGLLQAYWSPSFPPDARIQSREDAAARSGTGWHSLEHPPYPENPLIKQYSTEYWLTGDLVTPDADRRNASHAVRVYDWRDADVIFVPFFAALSAEMELGRGKGAFRRKEGNEDYQRQRAVVDLVRGSEAWKRSGGRDHVFVLTDPVAMWHVRAEIAPAILLVVDFGGWYRLDSKTATSGGGNGSSSDMVMIQHTQVSLLKDVIVPYTHLLPSFSLMESEKQERRTLLYFKGAKHRHRGGLVREKIWELVASEPDVVMEEGFPNATGREQSIRGMRGSEFCLHPAGDTPTSCRLFDAIQSLCIPVIVSDDIELPFEGMVDYSEFSVFVAVSDALQPNWLISHLRSYSGEQKNRFRQHMARAQPVFVYDNGQPGGIGQVPKDGAVNHIWRKVHQKLPMIREAIVRDRRKPRGVSIPLRCHCT
uniref:Exostosin GT47 domain-containing protein n=1 Tax=Kalanchoe fedtschenkoi TaxID=63787 RepID=A0A7N0UJA7_KALFE